MFFDSKPYDEIGKEITYTAPIGGIYRVSSEVLTYEPTGEIEIIANPAYRWYKFWLPKIIVRNVYRTIRNDSGIQLVHLKKGESVGSTIGISRL